ncbi:MAG: ZIP family metal transporter [Gemmatimonadetes bacterium]|nr:ZIP family metal transporter [Gemmatimonadota bacterium]
MTMTLYLALIAGITFAGGAAPLVRKVSRNRVTYFVSAGAGILLGAAFLHMMPFTWHALGERAGIPILGGFLLIFVLEKFFLIDPCEEVGCHIHKFGLAAFMGITFHSLLDGVAVGSSFHIQHLAPSVFAAIAVHKIPAAFCLASILLLAGYSRNRAAWMIAGFSLATPIGAVAAFFFLQGLSEQALAIAIGLSAGSFLGIATSDLLPQLHRESGNRALPFVFLFLGVLAMMLPMFFMEGHAH